MTVLSHMTARAFAVSVEYWSGAFCYALEEFLVEAADAAAAERLARARSRDSVYDNDRIAELEKVLNARLVDVGAIGFMTTGCVEGAIYVKPCCPRCGNDDIIRDATARWDIQSQCWMLSGTFDYETCGRCEAEGEDIANWTAIGRNPVRPAPDGSDGTAAPSILDPL